MQAWQRADADTKRCQYRSLQLRSSGGRTSEIATCVSLWLGAATQHVVLPPQVAQVAAQPVHHQQQQAQQHGALAEAAAAAAAAAAKQG